MAEDMGIYSEIDYVISMFYEDDIDDIIQGKRDFISINFQLLSKDAQDELNENFTSYVQREDNIVFLPTKHVNERCRELGIETTFENIRLFFEDVSPEIDMRDLTSEYINGLVQLNGIITSVTEPHSIMDVAMFQCKCGAPRPFTQYTTSISKPSECLICGAKRPQWILLESECEWEDYQEMKLQENPETTEIGGIPRSMTIRLKGKQLLDACKPGDLVDVVGVLMPEDIKKGKIFGWVIDVNSINVLTQDSFNVVLSDDDIDLIHNLAGDPEILELFIQSIFPSIHGHVNVKKGLTLALFSGVNRRRVDSTQRGTSNILLVGDPGTAKTRMLVAAKNASPKAVFTSGRGTSSAGLTAAAIQDSLGWRLDAGTLVLADKGVACIDEIEKMRPEDRSSIHDAMSQQIVAIDKANIHTTLNARTTVLAAGNPKNGRYDRSDYVTNNINLSPPILSRFDLIYIIQDVPEEETDRSIADKVLDADLELPEKIIPHDLIKKYILYSKRHKPKLTQDSKKILVDFYIPLRQKTRDGDGAVFISTRQLEGLRRLSEASARMRLSNEVSVEDAQLAIDLLTSCLRETWYDPLGDSYDVGITEGGKSAGQRKAEDIVSQILFEGNGEMAFEAIASRAEDYNIPRKHIGGILNKLYDAGIIYKPRDTTWCYMGHKPSYN
jgi:replicative DNA helicase Mcm